MPVSNRISAVLNFETNRVLVVKAAEDPDIEATASNMPLRCPLSTLRIQVPIRSKACTHNRCVDANSFLELQTQAPTWACPICNKPSPYESLVVDKYVLP